MVLPDFVENAILIAISVGLNAPTGAWCSLTPGSDLTKGKVGSQCTYRCVVLPDTIADLRVGMRIHVSQCTYRCVVLPDCVYQWRYLCRRRVSMHLQVRGAP